MKAQMFIACLRFFWLLFTCVYTCILLHAIVYMYGKLSVNNGTQVLFAFIFSLAAAFCYKLYLIVDNSIKRL